MSNRFRINFVLSPLNLDEDTRIEWEPVEGGTNMVTYKRHEDGTVTKTVRFKTHAEEAEATARMRAEIDERRRIARAGEITGIGQWWKDAK